MHFAAHPKESTEAHDQRTPAQWIDMGMWTLSHKQLFVDMQLHNVHFEHVGAHVFAKGAEIMHDALHLYGTLVHPG